MKLNLSKRASRLQMAAGAAAVVLAGQFARADVFDNVTGLSGYSVVYNQQIANYSGNSTNLGGARTRRISRRRTPPARSPASATTSNSSPPPSARR